MYKFVLLWQTLAYATRASALQGDHVASGSEGRSPAMKWVTRERPKVDRIACPWLIKRFVDPEAEFLYAPKDDVLSVAEREGATPYDIPDADLGHHGDECSFDAIVRKYELAKNDPAMARLALIV